MTKADKTHWKIVLVYGGLLFWSLAVLLLRPADPRFFRSVAQFLLIFGPAFVTPPLAVLLLIRMVLKRISLACGIGTIVFLAIVSSICLALVMRM